MIEVESEERVVNNLSRNTEVGTNVQTEDGNVSTIGVDSVHFSNQIRSEGEDTTSNVERREVTSSNLNDNLGLGVDVITKTVKHTVELIKGSEVISEGVQGDILSHHTSIESSIGNGVKGVFTQEESEILGSRTSREGGGVFEGRSDLGLLVVVSEEVVSNNHLTRSEDDSLVESEVQTNGQVTEGSFSGGSGQHLVNLSLDLGSNIVELSLNHSGEHINEEVDDRFHESG